MTSLRRLLAQYRRQQTARGAINADMAKKEWGAARELGLPITLHTNGSAKIKFFNDKNLLGARRAARPSAKTNAEDFTPPAKYNVHYIDSPVGGTGRTGEMQFPELPHAGAKVSISIDNVTAECCDCFACMHTLQTLNRHRTSGKSN